MSSIPLPALAIRPPEQQAGGPLEQYGKLLQLKALLNQQQLQPIQQRSAEAEAQVHEQQAQQGAIQLNDQKAQSAAMHSWDGKDLNELPGLILKHGGSAQAVFGMKNTILGYQKNLQGMDKDRLANEKVKNDYIAQAIDNVKSLPAEQQPQAFEAAKSDLAQKGYLDPQQAQQIQYQGPQQLDLLEKSFMGHSAAVESALKAQQARKAAASAQEHERVLAGMNAQGMTAAEQAAAQHQAGELAVSRGRLAEERRHNQASEGSLTPEALTMAAQQYAHTGVMPALGRTAGMRTQIMNEAARVYPKIDIASNAIAYAANKESLKKLQTNFDQMSAFEGTALKNLDLYLQKAKAIPDLSSRFANVPLRMITGRMVGEKNYAAMQAARQTAATETAKVLGSATGTGVLSDSQKKDASDVLDGNLPLKATIEVVDTLKQDFANRHQSYVDQIADIKKRIGDDKQETKTTAPPQGKPVYVNNKLVGYTADGKTMTPAQ